MVEFGWQELAGLLVGLLILAGSVAWGLRLSRSSITDIHRDVAQFDALLRAIERPELRVNPGPVYEHPLVGAIPSHSTLVGALDGYAIQVDLHNPRWDAEAYPDYVVRVRVTVPVGQAFDEARGSSSPLGLDSMNFQVRVDGRSLVVTETPRHKSTPAHLRGSAATLEKHLRSVVELARILTVADIRTVGTVADPAVSAQPRPERARTALFGKQVFLLEGDLGFAEALRAGLVDRGARPGVFEGIQPLVDAAERSLPDLFVVALELPGESGWAVCNRLKQHKQLCSVPLVVASTDFGEEEFAAHRRLSTRAQDYIAKPVSVEDMLARIELQLRNPATR